MLKIGIIGAGHISLSHLNAYKETKNCKVVAISDLNEELAKERANTYNIDSVYTDYKELLKDESIDAVSIVTPTFTHKDIIIDSLRSGKNVLCEKPPALNADEVRECEQVAKETGKLLMFAFVCRFGPYQTYIKDYIQSGKMGKIVSADCARTSRCSRSIGWFANRKLGGGILRDGCIHELDSVLYFMDYPKPISVVACETFINSDLPDKINAHGWDAYDKTVATKDVESAIEGFVTLDNGACIHVKASSVLNVVEESQYVEIAGEKAGLLFTPNKDTKLRFVEIDNDAFRELETKLDPMSGFYKMIGHFTDCVANGTECISKPEQAIILMQIIDALYESAKTGKPVVFE